VLIIPGRVQKRGRWEKIGGRDGRPEKIGGGELGEERRDWSQSWEAQRSMMRKFLI
jgi:hypothetical protein